MADQNKRNLQITTIAYWILLLYIIAALVWWTIVLFRQTDTIYHLSKSNLDLMYAEQSSSAYRQQLQQLVDQRRRSLYKYGGEGATFLGLILIGAVYIYRTVRKQFRLHRQQQNFVMAVTHELKTPIAINKLNLETLQKYQLDEEKRKKLMQTTLQETIRLDTLINNILIASQLEGNDYKLLKEKLDFTSLVTDVCTQFKHRYPHRTLNYSVQPEVDVEGDAVLLKLLISNLLENAHKYSPADGLIEVRLYSQETAVLEITDEGDGISEAEKKNIFEKFYRIGNENTRKAQGTGLGLFICKKIARDHQGKITVEDNLKKGSKFIVQLPLDK